jgi:hypothetical protein
MGKTGSVEDLLCRIRSVLDFNLSSIAIKLDGKDHSSYAHEERRD